MTTLAAAPDVAAEPEVVAARARADRFQRRYVVGVILAAVALIGLGSQVGRLATGPVGGVDLASPPHYDQVVRLRMENGHYELFGERARIFDLSVERDPENLPIDISSRDFVIVTWPADDEAPRHIVDAERSVIRWDGRDTLEWFHNSDVAVFAGPVGRQLVPVSRRAFDGDGAIKLLPR